LTGDDVAGGLAQGGTRGLVVSGGRLDIHGSPPSTSRTRITADVSAGDDTIEVESTAGWNVGDRIAVGPTDYYGATETEIFTIEEISGNEVVLDQHFETARWGRIQHATTTGVSLSADPSLEPPADPTPSQLDERATVVNMSRNIVIQGADDELWQTDGFGAHIMIMDLDSEVQVDGIELRRVGQSGILGRYPWHWHRLSYAEDGSELGDATGQYLRNSSISGSTNRCITIHATNGVEIDGNSCVGVLGHGVFTEDAVERRNTITNNTVMNVRNPSPGDALKLHEVQNRGSSAFWISNPDNILAGNLAADSQSFGYWLAYPESPFGPSSNVPINPDRLLFGVFDDNVAQSNQREGVMFDFAEIDDAGNVQENQYFSTTDGQDVSYPFSTLRRFNMRGLELWKNGRAGIWTRATWPTYTEFVSADNGGRFFAGSGASGEITRSLVVGTSLNSPTPRPPIADGPNDPTAFATYHSAFAMSQNVLVEFPLVDGERSGAFATDDYYRRPVDKGHIRNPDNLMINTAPGYRSPRPSPNYALAGALWDPYGTWSPEGTNGTWNVYDDPFLTFGGNCLAVEPIGSNAMSCDGEYFGVLRFQLDQGNLPWEAYMPIDVRRYDDAWGEVGQWEVGPSDANTAFGNMRHFAARIDGRFELTFPDSPLPTDVAFEVEGLLDDDDSFVLGVQFDGDEDAQVFSTTLWDHYSPAHAASASSAIKQNYQSVDSLAEVVAESAEVFWQDNASDTVWIKVFGGLEQLTEPIDTSPTSEAALYDVFKIRIH